jgi:pimeloyl-ACP methyl ester carboxylesterase
MHESAYGGKAEILCSTLSALGVYEAMQSKACTNMIGCHLVDGAGHWVQQEQPAEVSRLLLQFLHRAAACTAN